MSVEVDIKLLVDRARVAQQIVESYSQEQVDELITAMVWSGYQGDLPRRSGNRPAPPSPGKRSALF